MYRSNAWVLAFFTVFLVLAHGGILQPKWHHLGLRDSSAAAVTGINSKIEYRRSQEYDPSNRTLSKRAGGNPCPPGQPPQVPLVTSQGAACLPYPKVSKRGLNETVESYAD